MPWLLPIESSLPVFGAVLAQKGNKFKSTTRAIKEYPVRIPELTGWKLLAGENFAAE